MPNQFKDRLEACPTTTVPRVSVVLPVFNGERTIFRAIQSILDQTVRDFELIVVDDGSTDGTREQIARVQDSRLRVVSQAHAGVVSAANVATENAVAPIIARMDADDFAYPERLERQLELLQGSPIEVVGCQVRIVDETNATISTMNRYQTWINQETLTPQQILALRFVEFPLVNPTITARREYFELGFRQGAFPEDYDLMLRAAERGMRFGKVDRVLLDWTDHPQGLTRSDPRFTPAAFFECRRSHLLAGPLTEMQEVDIWGVGQAGKPWIRALQAASITVRRAYDISDRKIGATIHGVPVKSPRDLPPADGTSLLIAVGAQNARQIILPQILDRGYVSGRDAWFVA